MNDEGRLLARIIGEYLVSLRWEKRIRQQELAQAVQVTQRGLRKIEKGEVDVSAYLLRRLVLALGEDMGEFWQKVEKNMEVLGADSE